MTIDELEKLKQSVLGNELEVFKALEFVKTSFENKRPDLWYDKEWQSVSSEKKLDHCTQCGTREGIMVLQHLWHGRTYSGIKSMIQNKLFEDAIKLNPFRLNQEELASLKETKELCPKCERSSIYHRKNKVPHWICTPCGFEFEEPVICADFINPRKILLLQGKHSRKILQSIKDSQKDYIERTSFTIYIDDYIRYKECRDNDITTFCKKCAYMWDVQNCKLCDVCKQKYHSFLYPTCRDCIPKCID